MRTCSVCGKVIYGFDICKTCFTLYGNGSRKNYPVWLTELIKIQKHFETRGSARDLDCDDFEDYDTDISQSGE